MSSNDAPDVPATPGAGHEPAHMDPALAERIARAPDARIAVIVTARGALEDLVAALPAEASLAHAYRLIASVAIEAPGTAIALLADHPAVAAIEAVEDVQAWPVSAQREVDA